MADLANDIQDETWQSGARRQSSSVAPATKRPQLYVVIECDRPLSGGARYDLSDVDEVIIGRGPSRLVSRSCENGHSRLVLRLPGNYVSANHARLERSGSAWLLQDCGSTNGTYVNGSRISSVTLSDDDCIEVGHTLIVLRHSVSTPEGTETIVDSSRQVPTAPGLMTLDPNLALLYADIGKAARSALPIVLLGKTGTGKEVIARAIHQLSGRPGRFVAVNCGALTPSLVESQLFGHVRGAFSGAVRDESGLVRSAHRGTLFLDEIGELPRSVQVMLLRTLQESEVLAVGSDAPVAVDLRIVAAGQEALTELVERQSFREDLRARLEGFVATLPTLQQRRVDLGLLIADLLNRHGDTAIRLQSAVGRHFWDYAWPLNVRELEQTLRRASVLSGGNEIKVDQIGIPATRTLVPPATRGLGSDGLSSLLAADHQLYQQLTESLRAHHGNVSAVARAMGKARMQVQRWLKRFNLDPENFRDDA